MRFFRVTRTLSRLFPLLLLALTIASVPAQAQNSGVTITLSIPRFQEDYFKNTFKPQFEANNPGISLYLVLSDGLGAPVSPNDDVDTYLDDMQDYVSTADVLVMDSNALTPEATRAGELLDLSPLANTDPNLNPDDYYPALWQSVQWDGGIWGLPVSAEVQMLFYDPAAFDAAGLRYPDENWTLSDFENSVRTLTKYNTDGSVATPGLLEIGGNISALMLSFLNQDVVDDTVIPNVPDYSSPDLENLLTTWAAMVADGVIGGPGSGSIDLNTPMLLGNQLLARRGGPGNNNDNQQEGATTPALLPGSRIIANTYSFAVSGGTRYQDAAYTVAKYLSQDAGVANNFFGSTPARRSLTGVETDSGNGGPGDGGPRFFNQISPETQAVLDAGMPNALVGGGLRFANSLSTAVSEINSAGEDARTALNNAESTILTRLQTADDRRATMQIVVNPVPVAPTLNAGEVSIKFAATSSLLPAPNEDVWKAAAEEFAASDPEVGYVQIDTDFPNELSYMTENYDCFYLPSNSVQGGDLSLLRSLDPLMSVDPNFNQSDFIGSALTNAQVNNQTWMYPMTIQPGSMRYNRDLFQQAGAVEPNGTWTIQEFEDALRALKASGDGSAPFVPRGFDNGYLIALIAAYGGLPIDYRTSPPTINFTDPTSVEAIRQVLNLVKDGYIDYQPLSSASRGGTFTFGEGGDAIYTELGFGGRGVFIVGGRGGDDNQPPGNVDPQVSYPTGSVYTPVTYDIGGGYISASSQVTEPCYRFLSYIAHRADLFTDMPATRSVLSDPQYTSAQNADTLTFYNAMADQLGQPNTVSIPAISGLLRGNSDSFVTLWLNLVFDDYVLNDADLESELADAQTNTLAFQQCTANPPAFDANDPRGYFQFFLDCATSVDPDISSALGF